MKFTILIDKFVTENSLKQYGGLSV